MEAVLEDLPSSQTTSQQSFDTEHAAFFLPAQKLIIPPYPLQDFLKLYETDPLSKALIDSDTNLTVSPVECISESDELCEYVNDFNRRIDLESVLWESARDVALYGFSAHEIVGNAKSLLNSTKILSLKRIDPRFTIVEKDQQGRFVVFLQRPGFGSQSFNSFPAGLGLSFENRLDPESILYIASSSPRTTYGHPLLQSLKDRLKERNALITAAVTAAKNHANPINFLSWVTELPIDSPETLKQLELIKKATEKIDKDKSRWLVAAGGQGSQYDSNTLGHDSVPDLTPLIDNLTQDIIAAAGQSSTSLGYNFGSGGGVDSKDSSSRQTIASIIVKQRRLVSQLNCKLYRLLPLIESKTPSGEIVVRMQEPDLVSVKEKEETNTIKINNAILKARAGIVSGEAVAVELGHKKMADEKRFQDFIDKDQGEVNENDPNDQQQQRSAILGKGKDPGNNPTGGKK